MTNKGIFLLTALFMSLTAWANFGPGHNDPLLAFAESALVHADTIPLQDRDTDSVTNDAPQNPFDLNDPPVIVTEVTYDPESGYYIITEKIGDTNYRPPTYMTFDEYMEWSANNQQTSYQQELSDRASFFDKLTIGGVDADTNLDMDDPVGRYKEAIRTSLINRLFGGADLDPKDMIDIRPQGNIDLTFGVDYQNVENPILTERQRRQGGFDFDMAIQMNVIGKIGDKLNLATNYNTQATFNFDNQMNLEFAGTEDEIIQKIEAGNVSLPLRSSLIQGSQSLFGIKTDLRFGRLSVSAIASQKKSKRENLQVQGGTQLQDFEVTADQYDQNRHFFISHYNRDSYEPALANLPQINTLFRITKMQVWVTNTRAVTQNARDIVALMDLGEADPTKIGENVAIDPNFVPPTIPQFPDLYNNGLPDNRASGYYDAVKALPGSNTLDGAVAALQSRGLDQSVDFEKVRARLLSQTEYTFHPELGYISLNLTLQPDEVLGVAYEYTYNGEVFRVGEFTNDSPNLVTDTTSTNTGTGIEADLGVLYVKMLKSAVLDVELPMWDLMMKNIYSIGAYQVNPQDFKLDVLYQDPGTGFIRNLPDRAGPVVSKCNIISLLNLDNLNSQGDPLADGVFDFVPGITITPKNGRIIFPVLEPFGSSMRNKFGPNGNPDAFVYPQLYENTVFFAREFPELNRFVIRGTYKSSVSSRISLGAFNIPRGSVTVTAGGQQLVEGSDYDVDYNTGQVTILNDAYLNSGLPVNVSYEDNTLFGFQTKTLYGTRLDYEVSDNFNIGGTFMHVAERPFTQKVNIGDDPVSNSVFGLDVTFNKEAPGLTRFLDKLPLLQTKEKSQISFTAEGAALRPGHSRALNRVDQSEDRGGTVYIDDFEGSSTNFDLRTPATAWLLASTPSSFPEADRINDFAYGYNRAKMTWYRIDPVLRQQGGGDDPYTAQFSEQDIFPNRQDNVTGLNNVGLFTFDMAYYPDERGPYNFEATETGEPGISRGIDPNTGRLNNPETRWGGVMRAIQTNDFEAANVEYVEFWMLSPFIDSPSNPNNWGQGEGGKLSLNLGTISEDIMRDSRLFFENGLPTSTSQVQTDSTTWSRIPRGQAITNAFDNDPTARAAQDLGLDGINDEEENEYFADYVAQMNVLGIDVTEDPANDNYLYHRDVDAYGALDDPNSTPIIERYKRFNNPQGNSLGQDPNNTQNQNQNNSNPSSTNIPDTEDINRDNTLNEKEAYFEYDIELLSDGQGGIQRNSNSFIVDEVELGDESGVKWYQFRIPVGEFNDKFGNIQDFRSIRFMRMYASEFTDPVIMRFARLQLVRNQWRRYRRPLTGTGIGPVTDPNDPTLFEVASVNFEENSNAIPFPYVLPPGIQREQSLGAFPNALQNEQSLALNVCDLEAGDARAVYKIINLDIRRYERLKMFVHAESDQTDNIDELEPGELSIFMRLGSDFEDNYYEYEIPLLPSEEIVEGEDLNDRVEKVWREENRFDFPLALFRETKKARNGDPDANVTTLFEMDDPDKPDNKVRIVGTPDLGYVKGVMIGLRNTTDATNICAEVWANELRLSGLDERGGVAGLARLDIQLADFGNITTSVSHTGIGWGQLEQRVNDRALEAVTQYDVATNLELGKLLPKNSGLRVPFYAQYSTTVETPEFDPYQLDLRLKEDVLDELETREERDSIRDLAVDYTSIRGFNFTNVRKERMNRERKPMPWDVENLSLTYAFDRTLRHNPTVENEEIKRYRGSVDYNYASQLRPIAPFKNMRNKSPWLALIRDFNFNPLPNSISVRNDMNRHHGTIKYRFADELKSTYYDKRFTWDRAYGLQWNLSKGLTMGFNAVNSSVIDEIEEYDYDENGFPIVDQTTGNPIRPTDQAKKDTIMQGLRTGGRNKFYNHGVNVSYTLPTKQIPFLAWTQIKAQYQANYDWSRASLNTDSLGNVIQNGQTRSITGDLDLTKLYNESGYLKKINSKKRKPRKTKDDPRKPITPKKEDPKKGKQDIKFKDPTLVGEVVERVVEEVDDIIEGNKGKGKKNKKKRKEAKKKGIDGADDGSLAKGKKEKEDRQPSAFERALLRPLMMIRKARVSYSEDFSSVVPGFVPETRLLGQNNGFNAPGWDYVFGANYGLNWRLSDFTSWLDERGAAGDIINGSSSRFLNQQVLVNYTKNYDGKLTIEPFNDFRIDVNVNRSFSRNHSQYYKVQDIGGGLEHLNELDRGSLNMTYFTMRTLFGSTTEELINKFDIFENNRAIISGRLAQEDIRNEAYENLEDIPLHELDEGFGDYREGYGRYQQDVLIPAFLSAYTGKDASTFPLTVFDVLPRPNWKFTYNGLNKLDAFKNIFSSFNISHGYTSTLSINSFATDLDFQTFLVNEVTRNYFSTLEIPDLVISERFSPLIGVDIRMKNDMTARFDWNKSRNLAMSFTDYQLSETNSEEFTIGVGYRVKGFKLPFKVINIPGSKGKTNELENDLNFKLDVSYRDDVTINHLLDQEQTVPTRGSRVIRISPSIDYAVNKFVNVRLFFDRSRTIPKTSASFPITNTQGGVTIRFSLTQ